MPPNKGKSWWYRGEKHHYWKGGKKRTTAGYVWVKAPEHHLAMSNGYVPEHRLIAEAKIGRSLLPGEVVHHVNGVKDDNRPENLEVMPTRKHHAWKHSTRPADRQPPDAANPSVECACGCGATFQRYSKWGDLRLYVRGHWWRGKRRAMDGTARVSLHRQGGES